MDDSIAAFVRSVKIADCRIIDTPNLIFLCGGATAGTGPYLSARDFFNRYLSANHVDLARRVKLAEAINDWFDHDTFADLLELEGYLADISDLIVLFVESAGSIAELGAFAASEDLKGKTLAVLNSAHPEDRTFIADGPVRRLKSGGDGMVHYYDWNAQLIGDPAAIPDLEEMSRTLAGQLIDREQSAIKEKKLNLRSYGHTMLLIADVVELIGVSVESEIIECLSEWKFAIDRKKLQKYLSLLLHLGLISRKRHANQKYYISTVSSGFISYGFLQATSLRDRSRIKASIRGALAKEDPRRMRLYHRYLLPGSKARTF